MIVPLTWNNKIFVYIHARYVGHMFPLFAFVCNTYSIKYFICVSNIFFRLYTKVTFN